MSVELVNFSASKIRQFLSCEKKYEYKYVDGLLPRTYQRALEFGSIGHKFLENWYTHLKDGGEFNLKAISETIKTDRGLEDFDSFTTQAFETDLYTVHGMIAAYTKFYENDPKQWEILAVEQLIDYAQSFEGIHLRGIPDLVVKERNSDFVWIIDHKFLAQITQGLLKKLPLDIQVHMYLKMVKQYINKLYPELKIRGVIYNIVRKPGIRQKKDESLEAFQLRLFKDYSDRPEEFFFREYVIVTEHNIAMFEEFMTNIAIDMKRKHSTGKFIQNVFACDQYGECPYIELCLRGKEAASYLFKQIERPPEK